MLLEPRAVLVSRLATIDLHLFCGLLQPFFLKVKGCFYTCNGYKYPSLRFLSMEYAPSTGRSII